jgi:prepilin signal peptidase PulO-like enzyme (type II secretory pathway)
MIKTYVPVVICTAMLVYGGVIDYRRREIPNIVPISLLVIGSLFGLSLIWSILGLIIPAAVLLISARIAKHELPGGDFKLLCSLGFTCGLPALAAIIFLAGIGALAYGLARRLPVKRHIPLCTCIAPAYMAYQAFTLVYIPNITT